MKLFRSIPLFLALAVSGMFYANVSHAAVKCDTAVCTWSSPWRSDVSFRLTVGTDQDGKLRWVVSPRHNLADWQTGTMAKDRLWVFLGSTGADVMVEVARAQPKIVHGAYTLSFPTGMTRGIEFWANNGNDVVFGGNFTIFIGGIQGGLTGKGAKIFIIHPNDPIDLGGRLRTVFGGEDSNVIIAGPSLHAEATAHDRILLKSGNFPWGPNDVLCNLNNAPVMMIAGSGGDLYFGPAEEVRGDIFSDGGPTESAEAGKQCAALWAVMLKTVYSAVR